MKRRSYFIVSMALAVVTLANGQGMIPVLDQYSSMNESVSTGAGSAIQDMPAPFGQSFTPTFGSLDFIRLKLNDVLPNNGFGASIYLTLRSDSMGGAELGSTAPVFMEDGYAAVTTFHFPASMQLTPGNVYFFEVLVQPGSGWWGIVSGGYGYSGGSVYVGGSPQIASDLWFQTGILVPEPAGAVLMTIGLGALIYSKRLSNRRL